MSTTRRLHKLIGKVQNIGGISKTYADDMSSVLLKKYFRFIYIHCHRKSRRCRFRQPMLYRVLKNDYDLFLTRVVEK